MKRDFRNESILNIIFRFHKWADIRLRGRIFSFFSVFNNKSSYRITIDRGMRLINAKSIVLSPNVSFGKNARLEVFNTSSYPKSDHKIFIGDNTSFGDNFHCGAINSIMIGKNVLCGSNILITDHSHGQPKIDILNKTTIAPVKREIYSKGRIVIEDNVWIGDGVIILSGVTIGQGAIISANSVIRRDVSEYTIFMEKG